MGWNIAYEIAEQQVIALYNKGLLTAPVLDALWEPFIGSDIDTAGGQNLKAFDGLNVEQIICKTLEPDDYKDVIQHPVWYNGEEPGTDGFDPWSSNERVYDLFYEKIWSTRWHCV